ncbi:MAG: S1C family serine protease, partial [Actinomycetes bacterium]
AVAAGAGGRAAAGASVSDGPVSDGPGGIVDIYTRLPGAVGAGTGIVMSEDGLVVTNNHVVAGSLSMQVIDLDNGRAYSAEVVGADPRHDVAVVRMDGAAGLTAATVGDSDDLRVGARVIAVGNAGGRGGAPTVTRGRVTGLGVSVVTQNEYEHTRGCCTDLVGGRRWRSLTSVGLGVVG